MTGSCGTVCWEVEVRPVGSPEESEEAMARALEVLLQWYLSHRERGIDQTGSEGDCHEGCGLP